jgi:hypothetical protein
MSRKGWAVNRRCHGLHSSRARTGVARRNEIEEKLVKLGWGMK